MQFQYRFEIKEDQQKRLVPLQKSQEMLIEAQRYLHLFQQECKVSRDHQQRLDEVYAEIKHSNTYWQTTEELTYGAMVAWRNSARCIGRLSWQTLQVRDMRHLTTAEDIFQELVEHIRLATNNGKIKPMITVFAPKQPGSPGIRIWNPQLIRYAGYKLPNGSIIGDPSHVELTEVLRRMGWQGAQGGPFDILPVVIEVPPHPPQLFELPDDCILEVPISHPEYPWFIELGIKWHALPVISNMRMEIGGIPYTAAPFNGWYMGTEVGARNLGDTRRYNLLPLIAKAMNLDTSSDRTLWKDRALVELNRAVLHSFTQSGVTIVDHHTASRQFMHHEKHEHQCGRKLYADWGWIVPPMSASTTPVFHVPYEYRQITPNYFYQKDPWQEYSF